MTMRKDAGFLFAPPMFQRPAFAVLGQTTINVAPVVPSADVVSSANGGVSLAPLLFGAGVLLAVTELSGVTHVSKWFLKTLGLKGKGK